MNAPPTLQKLGGSYMLVVEKPEDLEHLENFDEALWVATGVPIDTLTCDRVFLEYVDHDGNGRVRTDEVREAYRWLARRLADRSTLADKSSVLRLAAIDTSHDDGKKLHAAAERILANLGKAEAQEISLDELRDRRAIMAGATTNGDGVIPPEAVEDADLAAFTRDVLEVLGCAADAGGSAGVSAELLGALREQGRAYLDWLEQGRIPQGASQTEILVWGPETPAAYEAAEALWDKLEEFFAISALTGLDTRVALKFSLNDDELSQLDLTDRAALDARLRAAPLARPTADELLDLDAETNPAYRRKLETLSELVLIRVSGRGGRRLTREQWEEVKRIFGPYREWQESRGNSPVGDLGEEKLRCYLDGPLPDRLGELINADLAVAEHLAQAKDLEKLILYQRWFMELVNNSVSFPRFYDPTQRSMVELGTLIMDGRQFKLNVKVADRAAHKRVAAHSHIFLMYVKVSARDEKENFEMVSAVTAGSTANLCVGKKGVFFTTDDREWDAEVVDLLSNPVNLWEALKSPFKRLGDFIGKQAERFSSSRYKDLESGLAGKISAAGKGAPAPAPAPQASKSGATRDLLLGGSVAVAALGGTFAFVTKTIASVKPIHVLLVLGAVLLVVAVPTMVIATVKLRRRNLSMLLEACGWSVNAPMRLTARIGRLFTLVPSLPEGAHLRRDDLVEPLLRKVPDREHGWAARLGGVILAAAVGTGIGLLLAGPLAPIIARALVRYLGL